MRTYGGRKRRYGAQGDLSHAQTPETPPVFSPTEGSEQSGSRESSPQTPKGSTKSKSDLTRLFLSPRKSKNTPRRSRRTSISAANSLSLSAEEGSDEDPECRAEWIRRKPSPSSVAARMAPRPIKRSKDSEKVQPRPLDCRVNEGLRSKYMLKEINECSLDRRQCHSRLSEGAANNSMARAKGSIDFSRVGIVLTAMQGRWRDLEEMESSDGAEADEDASNECRSTSNNLKTITDLRFSGENQQFVDDFEYMTAGLKPSCKPKVRSSICHELYERLCGVTNYPSSVTGHARIAHPFLANVRAAGLLDCLFDRLLVSTSELGGDASADVSVALIVGKMLEEASMRDELIVKENVWKLLWSILDTQYHGDSQDAGGLNDQDGSAQALALHPHTVALRAVNQLVKHTTTRPRMQHLLTPFLERCSDILWIFFCSRQPRIDDGVSIATLAAIEECSNTLVKVRETITVNERDSTVRPAHFATLMITMMDNLEAHPSQQDGILKCLCAVLRLLVSICHHEHPRFVHEFASDQSALRALTNMFMHACKSGVEDMSQVTDDAIVAARWFDIAALSLGTLTTLLERESNTLVAALLIDDGRIVYELGSVLKTLTNGNEERMTIMAGCLAVTLAILILKANKDEGRPIVLSQLTKSMAVKGSEEVCGLLISSLHRLVDDTTDNAEPGTAATRSIKNETMPAAQRDVVDTIMFELRHLHSPLEDRQATTHPHSTAFPHFVPHSIVQYPPSS